MNHNIKSKRKLKLARELGNSCGHCGSINSLQVHHIKSVASGGGNLIHNLKLLCEECHHLLHHPSAKKKIEFWKRNKKHKGKVNG